MAGGIFSVGGFDLALLHDFAFSIASGAYDPHDRDAADECRIPHIVSTRAIGKCFKKEA